MAVGCASTIKPFDGWSQEEKVWYGAFTVANIADSLQTRYIMAHPDQYREISSVYSWGGVDGVWPISAALNLGLYYLCDKKPEWRGWVLGFATGGKSLAVMYNREIGVQFWGDD